MTQRHDRRRRLLTDDSLADDESPPDETAAGGGSDASGSTDPQRRPYANTARLDRQRRIHDMFPSRYWTIAGTILGALALVAGIELAHVWATSTPGFLTAEDLTAFDLGAKHNLSQWFSSTVLGLCSLAAIFIYSVRRHRVDDYHGRYRVWIWTTIVCMLSSLGETTDAGQFARGICRWLERISSLTEPFVWPSAVGLMLGILAIRLAMEMRRSRLSMACEILAVICLLSAVAVSQHWLVLPPLANELLIARGMWLVGYVFVLATFLAYARYVVLEIDGLLAAPISKPKRVRAKTSAKAPTKIAIDQPQKAAPTHARTDLAPVESTSTSRARLQIGSTLNRPATMQASSAKLSDSGGSSLSRAERRRLRREAA